MYADLFLSFVSERYDQFQRVFLDKNLMFTLRNDYAKIRNGNIVIILVIGLGNVGKTTLAKNICYFMDTQFTNDMLCWGIVELVDKIGDTIEETERAYLCDEPSDLPHGQSKMGIILREIFGQMRQQKSILVFCATDLKDIPPTIMRKVTTLIYLDVQSHGYVIKNRPKFNDYPLDEVKKRYDKDGYKSVNNAIERYQFLEINTHKDNVLLHLDEEGEKEYLVRKKKELQKSIKKFKNIYARGEGQAQPSHEEVMERRRKIMELHNDGLSSYKIAREVHLSPRYIRKIVQEEKEEVGGIGRN